jgi:hypothetical protein
MSRIERAAHWWAARGWGVFPCQPGGKLPLGLLAPRGVHSASTDAAQVADWWAREPAANLGLAVPGDFMVLDVDSRAYKGPTSSRAASERSWVGVEALEALEAHYGALPATATAATPTGGRHYFLSLPDGVAMGNPVGLRMPLEVGGGRAAIDVRSAGGYVVAPPSTRPEGAYTWARQAPIAEAPGWLLELLHRAPVVEVAPREARVSAPMPSDPREAERVTRYRQAALRRALESVRCAPQGGRHAAIRDAALQVGHLLGPGLDEAVAEEALVAAGVAVYGREARAGRIREAVRWGLARGSMEPTVIPDREMGPPDPSRGARAEALWAARLEECRWSR